MTDQVLWRIGTDTPDYTAEDPSGKGAEATGGRWNRKGTALLYTSASAALACLETLVHLNAGGLPLNRYLVQIRVPGTIWAKRSVFDKSVHVGWDAIPAGKVSIAWGTAWAKSLVSLCAVVPSVIVPDENNVLINSRHADATKLTITKVGKWTYDARLSKR
jgi:RES domain-containing protein